MFYAARGNIPPKRHTQHRAPDGALYAEELFGVEGFTGRSSLLYHVTPPTQTHRIEPVTEIHLDEADDGYHHHRLIDAAGVEPHGDAVTGRISLFFNSDVVMGVLRPAEAMPETVFYRNGEADELLYVHEGAGLLDTVFGPIRYGPGDYLVLPIGTTWRLVPDGGDEQRMLYLECPSEIEPPKRYRNDYGQLLEHSPYSQRDIRLPDEVPPRTDEGEFRVHVKMRGRLTAYHYRHHPFDVVGWDGYLWPFAFDIADFQPITGRVHQPPPVHQTFQARNFVVNAYGLSKVAGEGAAQMLHARTGAQALSLRPALVIPPQESTTRLQQVRSGPVHWLTWTYSDAEDLADAYRLAIENDTIGCEAFYIVNDEAFTDRPIEELLAETYPKASESQIGVRGMQADVSNAKAKRLLGWQPRHSWHEYDT